MQPDTSKLTIILLRSSEVEMGFVATEVATAEDVDALVLDRVDRLLLSEDILIGGRGATGRWGSGAAAYCCCMRL